MIQVMVHRQRGLNRAGALFLSVFLFLFGLAVFTIAAGSMAVLFSALHGASSWMAGTLFLAIVLVFAAVGIGLMILAWRIPRDAREQKQRQERHPDEPWLWREDWEQGVARAAGRNKAVFRMSSMPGVLGGKLRGVVETGGQPCAGRMSLSLSCILWKRQYRYGMSEILWEDRAIATCSAGRNGAEAAVEFDIPYDLRATGSIERYGWEEVFWSLWAASEAGGFHASFAVPVFSTAQSDASQTRESLDAAAGARLGEYAPPEGRIQKATTPEGIRYHFPHARNRSMAFLMSFLALIPLGVASLFALQVSNRSELGMLAGVLVAGALGLILVVLAVWLWFAETTVTAATHELTIHSACLGFAHTQVVHGEDIRGFDIKPGMQKGSEVWYDVWLQTRDKKSTNAGTGLSKTEAEWFVAELRKDLGLPDARNQS